jgi:hypothetical protein
VNIVYANGTEDRGFESRQGARFLALYALQCCSLEIDPHSYSCVENNEQNYFKIGKNVLQFWVKN